VHKPKKHLRGQKAILILEGLPAHKRRKMKHDLERQRSWLQVETLPDYSPDLNPIEDFQYYSALPARETKWGCCSVAA
jgi:transposase